MCPLYLLKALRIRVHCLYSQFSQVTGFGLPEKFGWERSKRQEPKQNQKGLMWWPGVTSSSPGSCSLLKNSVRVCFLIPVLPHSASGSQLRPR